MHLMPFQDGQLPAAFLDQTIFYTILPPPVPPVFLFLLRMDTPVLLTGILVLDYTVEEPPDIGAAGASSISQTGLVPVSAKSILFVAQGGGAPGAVILLVSLGGQNIPFYALSTVAPYTSVYGGNIPPTFAGQIEQLTFSALEGENFWNIDDVQFSSSSVPEPSEFALAALGALLLGFRRRRNFFTRR